MSDPRLHPVTIAHRLPGHDAAPVDIRAACDHAAASTADAGGPDVISTGHMIGVLTHVLDDLTAGIEHMLAAIGPTPLPDLLRPRMGRDDYVDDSLHQLAVEIAAWCDHRGDVSAAAVCERLRDLIRHVLTAGDLDAGEGPRS